MISLEEKSVLVCWRRLFVHVPVRTAVYSVNIWLSNIQSSWSTPSLETSLPFPGVATDLKRTSMRRRCDQSITAKCSQQTSVYKRDKNCRQSPWWVFIWWVFASRRFEFVKLHSSWGKWFKNLCSDSLEEVNTDVRNLFLALGEWFSLVLMGAVFASGSDLNLWV